MQACQSVDAVFAPLQCFVISIRGPSLIHCDSGDVTMITDDCR